MCNPSRSAATQLLWNPGFEYTSTSSLTSSSAVNNPSDSHSLLFFFATPSCMDLSRHGQNTSGRQLRPQQSNASLHQSLHSAGLATQPRSSPLPQAQWSEIPLPYRPRDWVAPEERQRQLLPDPTHDWRLRPAVASDSASSIQVPAPLRVRRRPRGLRNLISRSSENVDDQSVDYSLLYPQMSPYDGQLSSYSAPDELEHMRQRSVSQPSTPNYFYQPYNEHEPQPMQLPRAPTYPPSGRRHMHSDTGVQDAAFADEEEFRLFVEATAGLGPEQASRHSRSISRREDFRLFVEATAGLGPEQAFRHSQSHSSSGSSQRRRRQRNDHRRAAPPEDPVSPLEETPTTMMALQQLAQMPQASDAPPRQRLQTSTSGLDLWLHPPGASPSAASTYPMRALDVDLVEDEFSHDDELPDYASSQAEAQTAQRVEAARRAQELQRRWQQSGGARPY